VRARVSCDLCVPHFSVCLAYNDPVHTHTAAYYNRGICRYKQKRYDQALVDLQRALVRCGERVCVCAQCWCAVSTCLCCVRDVGTRSQQIEPGNANYINGLAEMRLKYDSKQVRACYRCHSVQYVCVCVCVCVYACLCVITNAPSPSSLSARPTARAL
jgi:hypothetical protein